MDSASEDEKLDAIIIGWGKGGKTLAGTLARAGQRVAIIEQSSQMYGGTCINIGCVPTKALIHDAESRHGAGYDQQAFQEAVQRRDKLNAMMRAKNFSMLDDLESVLVVNGKAAFTGPRSIKVTAGSEELELSAGKIIINTGALPAIPDIEGAQIGARVHDSTTIQHAQLPSCPGPWLWWAGDMSASSSPRCLPSSDRKSPYWIAEAVHCPRKTRMWPGKSNHVWKTPEP